jgi:hypothetical protein
VVLAFVLNPEWKIAPVRLYSIWADTDRSSAAWASLPCSLEDAVPLTTNALRLNRIWL